MRLLLSSYFYPPSIGGLERQTHLLAKNLVARGHEVRVISARLPGFAADEVLDGVRVSRVPLGGGSRYRRMATYVAKSAGALVALRREVDLIQVQQVFYPAAAAALVAPHLGLPLVVSNRGSGLDGTVHLMRSLPLGAAALRLIGANARCISLTEEMEREMRSAGMLRYVRIPNGVLLPPAMGADARSAAKRELGVRGRLVVFVGRLALGKEPELLVRAFLGAAPPDAELWLIGDGELRAPLERLAAPRVRLCGERQDVGPFLRAADAFVLPSRSEGMPNALLEAMAHGVPSIATDVPGSRDVMGSPPAGLLVPPGDEAALGRALARLLDDEDLSRALGRAGRLRVERSFSVDAMVSAHEALYTAILESARPR